MKYKMLAAVVASAPLLGGCEVLEGVFDAFVAENQKGNPSTYVVARPVTTLDQAASYKGEGLEKTVAGYMSGPNQAYLPKKE